MGDQKNTILLERQVLRELDLPYSALEDRIVGVSRWSVGHEIVFKYGDKFYRTGYRVGATEMQDESPWEFDSKVECEEVEQRPVLVMQWVPVSESA